MKEMPKVCELASHSGAAKLWSCFIASAGCTKYASAQEPKSYDLCLSSMRLLGEGKRHLTLVAQPVEQTPYNSVHNCSMLPALDTVKNLMLDRTPPEVKLIQRLTAYGCMQ